MVIERFSVARYSVVDSRDRGFTLIELLIVVAIIGIIAAVAVPSYSSFMTESRRSDAIDFLSELAGEQARYFSDNNRYATSMAELGYGTKATFNSPKGYYSISVANATNQQFVLTATPVADGKQSGDDDCKAFTISHTGARKNTGTQASCW